MDIFKTHLLLCVEQAYRRLSGGGESNKYVSCVTPKTRISWMQEPSMHFILTYLTKINELAVFILVCANGNTSLGE